MALQVKPTKNPFFWPMFLRHPQHFFFHQKLNGTESRRRPRSGRFFDRAMIDTQGFSGSVKRGSDCWRFLAHRIHGKWYSYIYLHEDPIKINHSWIGKYTVRTSPMDPIWARNGSIASNHEGTKPSPQPVSFSCFKRDPTAQTSWRVHILHQRNESGEVPR